MSFLYSMSSHRSRRLSTNCDSSPPSLVWEVAGMVLDADHVSINSPYLVTRQRKCRRFLAVG
jgi:hypothetical protein